MFFWNSFAFLDDPVDVGNLISGSSAVSKTSLNIRKFMVHVLLKPDWRILSITLLIFKQPLRKLVADRFQTFLFQPFDPDLNPYFYSHWLSSLIFLSQKLTMYTFSFLNFDQTKYLRFPQRYQWVENSCYHRATLGVRT